ncbi:MAG: holin family protein [Anaerolineae bacterium]|nr:holin family protein [Anaerolineae bacterium]
MISEAVKGFMEGAVKPILDKFIPDAQQRLEAENMIYTQAHAISQGQIEINKLEAQSSNVFVAGWRPFIGWVCGASFAYAVIGNDLLNWGLQLVSTLGHAVPALPEPDVTLTFEILMALLGLGGLRTFEKMKGVHRR